MLHSEIVAVLPDGSLRTQNTDSVRLILQLDLNSPRLKSWRVMWMRIVDLAEERDEALYDQLVGFPDDLPTISCSPKNRSFGYLSLAEVKRRLDESVPLGVKEYYFTVLAI